MTVLLNPKLSEIGHFFCMLLLLVAYLGHGIFHTVTALFFSESVCLGEALSSQIEG